MVFDDAYLVGHARRIGLASEHTPPDMLSQILPTVRFDVNHDSDRIRDAQFAHFYRLGQAQDVAANAAALAGFLSIGEDQAATLAQTPYLFVD